MPRKPADLRISIKKRGGKTYRIELIRQDVGGRFWVRRDGKLSESLPEATASEIADRIRRWIVEGRGRMMHRASESQASGLASPGSCLAIHDRRQRFFNSFLGSNDSRLGDDYSRLAKHYSSLGNVDSRLASFYSSLGNVYSSLGSLCSRLGTLCSRLGSV